jgi:hypothetical protein
MWFYILLFCILIVGIALLSTWDTKKMYERQEADKENEKNNR